MEFKTITEEHFDENFNPIENHIDQNAGWNGCMFETYGEELEFVKKQPNNTVWTIVTGDDDSMSYISGFHFVNRIGYLITKETVATDVEYDVPLDTDMD